MNKVVLGIFLSFLYSSIISAQNIDENIIRAEKIYHFMQEAKGDSIWALSSSEVQNAITPPQLSNTWASCTKQFGKLVSAGEWQESELSNFQVYYRDLIFEKYELRLNVVFNSDGQCSGINVIPVPVVSVSERRKMDDSKIEERDITIQNGEFQLPGTLSMPKNISGKIPVLILVHGSGPNDRDESIGALKPFQELAWGLSEQGIAVIRYDKRTKVYGAKSSDDKKAFTYDDETVDDAIAAIQLAKSIPGIDPDRIFVLGHSLGGLLVPRIAEKAGDQSQLAGVISLAGPTRKLESMLIEQFAYLGSLKGSKTDGKAEAAQVMNSLPTTYREFEQAYDPVETAKKLKLPILILQGERDYQVTMEDYGYWRMGLIRHANVRFKSYPKLNHALQEGKGKSTPMEYHTYTPIPDYQAIQMVIMQLINGL